MRLPVVCVVGCFLGAMAWLAVANGPAQARCATAEPPIDVNKADWARWFADAVEAGQSAEGKAAGAHNGWTDVIEAVRLAFAARDVVRKAEGDGAPIDPTVIYDSDWKPDEGGPSGADAERVTRAFMRIIAEGGAYAALDRAASATRMARARLGTPERAAEQRAAGADEPWDGRLVAVLLPELGGMRLLARVCAARMHDAATKGDGEAFAAAFEHGLMLARAALHQGTVIDRLVGDAITELTLTQAMAGLTRFKPSEDVLARMQGALDRQTGTLPGPVVCVQGERAIALDACRWVFLPSGQVNVKALQELGSLTSTEAKGMGFLQATREGNVRTVQAVFAEMAAWVRKPRAERVLADPIAAVEAHTWAEPDWVMIRLMAPALHKLMDTEDVVRARRAGFAALLAVERFERKAGWYPVSFNEVVARGVLETAPRDPINDVPWVLVRPAEADAKGRPYLIYSPGADGRDDEGKSMRAQDAPPGRALLDPAKGAGFDFVINEW